MIAGEVPGDRHAPPEIRLQGLRRRHPGARTGPLIEGGIPTEALLAQSRSPNMPTGCRSTGRKPSMPAPASRSTACDGAWMGKVGFDLAPLADHVLEKIKQAERIFADETPADTGAGHGQGQDRLVVGLCTG